MLITNVKSKTIGPRCHCVSGAVNQFSDRTNLWISSPTTSARIGKQRSEREREEEGEVKHIRYLQYRI